MNWRHRGSALRRIQRDALNSRVPISKVLREVIVLGGRSGSQELIDWAMRELNGYGKEDKLPPYRHATAPLQIDGATMTAHIRQQTLAPFDLPDFAQDYISNELELRMAISTVEHLVERTAPGEVVKLSPPGADNLVSLMNRQGSWQGHIERLYWCVSPVVFVELVEGVRTALVSFTAQLEAVTGPDGRVPSSAATDNSVAVAIYGDRSRIKNLTVYSAGGDISFDTAPGERVPWWRRWWSITLAAVTLASAGLALMQVQGWHF